MSKTCKEHISLLVWCCSVFCYTVAYSAGNDLRSGISKVDSLNETAFYRKRFDVAGSMSILFASENLASSINYQKGLAVAYLYEAGIFQQNGFEKRALATYYQSLRLFQNLKDTFNIARASKEIAASLQADKKTKEALELFNQTLLVYASLHKRNEIANIKNSIGLIEMDLGQTARARKYFQEALETSLDEKYLYGEKKSLYNLGLLEEKEGNLMSAEAFFKRSMVTDKILNDKYGEALNLLALSSIQSKRNQADSVIYFSKHAYDNAAVIGASNLLKEAAVKLVDAYRNKGDNREAGKWQDSLVHILQLQIDNEKGYAFNFIDIIKNQDLLKFNAENEVLVTKRVEKQQLTIIIVGTFILIIVAVFAVLALVNYQRQRFFGKELKKKNAIIEKNASSLDQLNKEISQQNLLLEEENRTKNKLLSIISHDLRTPMVNTKGILNLLNNGMISPEDTTSLMLQLEAQYQGTTSLLDNLLFWIKGHMSGKGNDKILIYFQELIKALEEEHRVQLDNKNIRFQNTVDPSIILIAEKEMMRIVFRNLISNAIKFTPESGQITISAKIENAFIFLAVQDSGIGMTSEAIRKVNARQYYSTKGTLLEKGTGFGLMLCHDLITKNGGELILESEPGVGSLFTVKMPYGFGA